MGFKFVACGQWKGPPALCEGECSVAKSGAATFLVADLESAGISTHVAVLADVESMRVAIRAPRAHERAGSVAVSAVMNKAGKPTGRARINLRRGVAALGVTIDAVAGRYSLLSIDDLLIVPLGSPAVDELERANSAAAERAAELAAREGIDCKAAALKAAREAGRQPAGVSAGAGRK